MGRKDAAEFAFNKVNVSSTAVKKFFKLGGVKKIGGGAIGGGGQREVAELCRGPMCHEPQWGQMVPF